MEIKDLLARAQREILDLRRRNEILEAQISVIDTFAAALGLGRNGGCMTIDIVGEIQDKIEQLGGEEK